MIISTERKYNARITAVFKNGASVDGPQSGPLSSFKYKAQAVDTHDQVNTGDDPVAPFRRFLFGTGTNEPDINAAQVGDDCDIAMCQGQARLTNVPEQYIAGGCDDTTTTPS